MSENNIFVGKYIAGIGNMGNTFDHPFQVAGLPFDFGFDPRDEDKTEALVNGLAYMSGLRENLEFQVVPPSLYPNSDIFQALDRGQTWLYLIYIKEDKDHDTQQYMTYFDDDEIEMVFDPEHSLIATNEPALAFYIYTMLQSGGNTPSKPGQRVVLYMPMSAMPIFDATVMEIDHEKVVVDITRAQSVAVSQDGTLRAVFNSTHFRDYVARARGELVELYIAPLSHVFLIPESDGNQPIPSSQKAAYEKKLREVKMLHESVVGWQHVSSADDDDDDEGERHAIVSGP